MEFLRITLLMAHCDKLPKRTCPSVVTQIGRGNETHPSSINSHKWSHLASLSLFLSLEMCDHGASHNRVIKTLLQWHFHQRCSYPPPPTYSALQQWRSRTWKSISQGSPNHDGEKEGHPDDSIFKRGCDTVEEKENALLVHWVRWAVHDGICKTRAR